MAGGEPETVASVRDRIEYAAYRVLSFTLSLLPERMADVAGAGLGWVVGAVLRIRRDVVDANLRRAFPEMLPSERDRLALESYRHLGREAVATVRAARANPAEVRARTKVRGLEAVVAARNEGRGAILVTGHLGNWEIGGSAVAVRGLPVDAVALRQRNRLFDRELLMSRERLGMRVIRKARAPREVLRSVREGRVPALVADQNVRSGGVFVDFFGVPASTARGPAVLSLRSGAPLFVGIALRARDDDGPTRPARYDVHFEEVEFTPTGDVEADVRGLTRAHTDVLERWVRTAPEQYFWVHKRWKTRPEEGIDHGGTGSDVGAEDRGPLPGNGPGRSSLPHER